MNLAPLAPLYERPGPWASVYVDTSAADQAPSGRHALLSRQVCADLAAQGADEATCKAVGDALDAYAGDPRLPGDAVAEDVQGGGASGRVRHGGRAIFAAHGEVVLEPALTIAPPTETATSWGPLPHVAPLLELAPPEAALPRRVHRPRRRGLRAPHGRRPQPPGGQRRRRGRRGLARPRHGGAGTRRRTALPDERREHVGRRTPRTPPRHIRGQARRDRRRAGGARGDDRERRTVRVHLPRQLNATVVESPHGGRARGADNRLLEEDVDGGDAGRSRVDRTADALDRFRAGSTISGGRPDAAEGVPALVEAAREHRIGTLFLQPQGSGRESRGLGRSGPGPARDAPHGHPLPGRPRAVRHARGRRPDPLRDDDGRRRRPRLNPAGRAGRRDRVPRRKRERQRQRRWPGGRLRIRLRAVRPGGRRRGRDAGRGRARAPPPGPDRRTRGARRGGRHDGPETAAQGSTEDRSTAR